MITFLSIKNFQGHGSFKLKLGPVTTIIGPTDSGKSSIIRALRWVMRNKPRGASFLKEGEYHVSILLKVDGHKVRRRRGKGGNHYLLDGDKFTAFGSDVPTEIAQILNVSEMNFQGQHDASGFWFSLTPGEVSRRLNRVVDLGSVDTTLAHLQKVCRKADLEFSIIAERLEEAEADREKCSSAKRMDAELQTLEGLDSKLQTRGQRAALLAQLTQNATEQHAVTKRLAQAASQGSIVRGLETVWLNWVEHTSSLAYLLVDMEKASEVADLEVPDLSPLTDLRDEHEASFEQSVILSDLIAQIQDAQNSVKSLSKKKRKDKQELDERMGDTCPLCGSIRSDPTQ